MFSCSRIELASTWADGYIYNQIDKYFEVGSMQAQFLKKALREDIERVKKEIFPAAASELERFSVLIEKDILFNAEMVEGVHLRFKNLFYKGLAIFEPNAQAFVQKLATEQIETFKKVFNRRSEELNKDLADPPNANKKRIDKIEEQFEIWLSSLNEGQKFEIQKFVNDNQFPLKEQIINREKIYKDFLESYNQKNKSTPFIHQLFTNYESMRDAPYEKSYDVYLKNSFVMIASVLNKISPIQKKYISGILKDRIDQLRKASEKEEKARTARAFFLR